MRLIIEWLDKDGTILFSENTPSVGIGDTVQVSPIIPRFRTMFTGSDKSTIVLQNDLKGMLEEEATRYLKERLASFRIRVLEDEPETKVNWLHTFEFKGGMDIKETAHAPNIPLGSPSLCECCGKSPHQYTLSDNDYKYQVCANCLLALVNTALSPAQFFSLIRNGHTTKEHLLHGDFYDDETGEALQPR
jgi:hypothetical protein